MFYHGVHAGALAGGRQIKRVGLFLLIPLLGRSQDLERVLKQGEEVFDKTCATGYCHGQRGTTGGAPRLAARGFDQAFLTNIITRGVPGTSMPSFGTILGRPELAELLQRDNLIHYHRRQVIERSYVGQVNRVVKHPYFLAEQLQGAV